uniref:Glutaredoxin domain-containing protein n=1 Tax=Strongyloides venezuelensis TaxID=75913 RepID=A0A0K0FB32_STRVS
MALNLIPDVSFATNRIAKYAANPKLNYLPIILNEKMIEVEGLDDAAFNQICNLLSSKNLFPYTFQNPEDTFTCIYKVHIGKIEKFKNYKPIFNETHSAVKYPNNRLR